MDAASSGNIDIVKILFKAGANLNLQDQESETALMKAILQHRTDVVKFLIENGADHKPKK